MNKKLLTIIDLFKEVKNLKNISPVSTSTSNFSKNCVTPTVQTRQSSGRFESKKKHKKL